MMWSIHAPSETLMRILLAEDDPSIAEGICASLRHGGHAVDHVADGSQADAALRDHGYDLLVLDLGLPGLDGSEVLQRLRRRGKGLPVVVVTARDGLAERKIGRASCRGNMLMLVLSRSFV